MNIYIYKNKNFDTFLKAKYSLEVRLKKSRFRKEIDVKDILEEYKDILNYENKEFQPLENYVINFYGNNRIVALRHPSKEPVDYRLRGESAFWFTYDEGDNIMAYFPSIYLYLPKRQPLDSLQMIP
ncbi:hypothetical protein ACSTS3_21525 [Aquimarina muelleri]|uniref:hypothetical protein n=1 Tax=Aquimarina muelleri TaxID=279356 RepID=UPI003F683EF4